MGFIIVIFMLAVIVLGILFLASIWGEAKAEENPTTRKLLTATAVCITIILGFYMLNVFI